MNTFLNNLNQQFKSGSILIQLIYINVGIWLLIRVIALICLLFNASPDIFLSWIEMPSNPAILLTRPWTILTYMVAHYDVLHILFNMLCLYWFGQIFLIYNRPKQLGALYILGGIAGGLLYLISYNVFPYFANHNAWLIGASASIMAIVIGISTQVPEFKIRLLFIGEVKLKWLALATLVLDVLSVSGDNGGGHIAHIGGALVGLLYGLQIRNGKDITAWLSSIIDNCVNSLQRITLKKKSPFKKAKYNAEYKPRNESDAEYHQRKHNEEELLNAILEKIKKSGYQALSEDEKKQLFSVSKKQ